MIERWLPVVGFEGRYEVSSYGRVRALLMVSRYGERRLGEPRLMKCTVQNNGYASVGLSDGPRKQRQSVHRMVLRAFVGEPKPGEEGAHLDGRRTHNTLENLTWASRKVNHSHKALHGTQQRGERCGKSKLRAHEVAEIRARYMWRSKVQGSAALAREYGVTATTILHAVHGYTWNVPEAQPMARAA